MMILNIMKGKRNIYLNVLLLLLIIPRCFKGADVNVEQRLLESLLTNYTGQARPVLRQSTSTNVSFGIEFIQLIEVNDRMQMITSKVWVRQSWKNQLITWNPKLWNNIKSVNVEATLLWIPDIVLYNSAAESFSGGTEQHKTAISMYSNGKHSWLSPATFISTCKIDVTYFPFDQQRCILKFGSWTYDKSRINMLADIRPVITKQYVNSSEWEITDARLEVNLIKYACCVYPYPDVTVVIILKRKPLYYVFNVIAPCLVLAATILFGFFLPPSSGERITLTITILLAVAVFLQLVSDSLPRNSDSVALLALFYMVIMAECALSLIITCIVLVFHYRSIETTSATPLPYWVRRVFLDIIGRYLKVGRPGKKQPPKINPLDLKSVSQLPIHNPSFAADNISYRNATAVNQKPLGKTAYEDILLQSNFNFNCNSTLESILAEIRVISDNVKVSDLLEETQEELKYLSLVLDRLFFWIFLFTIVISSLAILLPTYFKYN